MDQGGLSFRLQISSSSRPAQQYDNPKSAKYTAQPRYPDIWRGFRHEEMQRGHMKGRKSLSRSRNDDVSTNGALRAFSTWRLSGIRSDH